MNSSVLPFVDALILLISTAGVTVSVLLSAWGVSISPGPLEGPAAEIGKWTLLAILPLGMLFVARLQARERIAGAPRAPDYSGCPPWLRAISCATMVAGVLLFFYPAALQFSGIGPVAVGTTLPSTLPGGFGLVAYTSIFAQTYSSIALGKIVSNRSQPVL